MTSNLNGSGAAPSESSVSPQATSWIVRLGPDAIFGILVGEIVILAALMIASLVHTPGLVTAGTVYGGVLPIVAPWAGAIGGAAFALHGLVYHWKSYREPHEMPGARPHGAPTPDDQKWTWNAVYLASTFLGAIFGTAAALIVVYLTKSVAIGEGAISPSGKIIIAIIALVVGFQQTYFITLIKKVGAIIFADPNAKSTATQNAGPERHPPGHTGEPSAPSVPPAPPVPPVSPAPTVPPPADPPASPPLDTQTPTPPPPPAPPPPPEPR